MRKEKGRGERDGNKEIMGKAGKDRKKIIKRWSAKIRRDADKGRERGKKGERGKIERNRIRVGKKETIREEVRMMDKEVELGWTRGEEREKRK